MSLKKEIVIVNEYSVPTPGGGGSRGGTPGEYVTRYMAREGATETVAPIRRHRTDDFIMRYMAREDAVESASLEDYPELKPKMKRKGQGNGGEAFGRSKDSAADPSLSHEDLKKTSDQMQQLFDNGHTVMKTVISFDQEYLKKHGVVDEDFEVHRRGAYRGQIDQMKMRLAVMRGVERMQQQRYDDLVWVGTLQVDTEHAHVHLAMMDAGEGRRHHDGTQIGKIDERSKSMLRRGTDAYLDEKQHVAHLSSAVGYDSRNVSTYIKRWAHEQMTKESLPQFLIATLPQDRRFWRGDTNREEMRKPNAIVREMVTEVLNRPGSPMGQAMEKVNDYANHRLQTEELTTPQYKKLVDTGRERIVDKGVNAVYSSLRQMPEDQLRLRTPMLDVMGMDYEEMASQAHAETDDEFVRFGFRLRSYASRMEHHDDKRAEAHEQARAWEASYEQAPEETSRSLPLHVFNQFEEEYHAKVAAKYRKFLDFTPPRETWYEGFKEVDDYARRLSSLESMRADASLKRMKDPDEAEKVALEVYGQRGGHLVSVNDETSRQKLAERVDKMRTRYQEKVEDFRVQLAGKGLRLESIEEDGETGSRTPQIKAGPEYDFEQVKGLDLHHMRYDFASDVKVGQQARQTFVDTAGERKRLFDAAREYVATTQPWNLYELPESDVLRMSQMAEEIENQQTPTLVSEVAKYAEATRRRRSATVVLTNGTVEPLSKVVSEGVGSFDPAQPPEEPLRELKQKEEPRVPGE